MPTPSTPTWVSPADGAPVDASVLLQWTASTVGGSDTSAPTFNSATVAANGTTLTVNLNENTSPPILPASGITGFTVTVAGANRAISSAVRSGNTSVVLTLASAVNAGQTVTVAYTPGNITDSAGNSMAAFGAQTVTNNSTQGGGGIQLMASPVDDFGDGATTGWTLTEYSGSDVSETGGQLHLTAAAGADNYAMAETTAGGDLTGKRARIRLVQNPPSAATRFVGFKLFEGSSAGSHQLEISVSQGLIWASGEGIGTNLGQRAYDATAFYYLAIRHDADANTLVFEGISQGGTVTTITTVPRTSYPYAITNLRVQLYCGQNATVGTAATAIFDDLNV